MKSIVYILGAGCSAFKDGYPLARDFREALRAAEAVPHQHYQLDGAISVADR